MPTPNLLSSADPHWEDFQANDPDWNLLLAGEAVRLYCGWDIYPNQTYTETNLPVGSKGIVQVRSLKVTAVASVVLQDPAGVNNQTLDPAMYTWFDYGVIEPVGWQNWGAYGGYYYGSEGAAFLPVYQFGLATVTYTGGYDEVPVPVKGVAYELAQTTIEVNAGNVKEIQTPGFRLQLLQAYGATLNPDQKSRLESYRLPAVK